MNEENIENYLNNRMNKRSILKSVLTEYNEIIDIFDEVTNTKKDYKKFFSNIKFCKKYLDKTFYFIFEDNPLDPFLYHYNVIRMKKEKNNSSFMKDITSKLNDFQQVFSLSAYLTDENSIYFFMYMPTDMNNNYDSSTTTIY